jgi:hypothetical protein
MRMVARGFVLLAVQAALVAGTAGKYLWERHTRPMVWVKTSPFVDQEVLHPSQEVTDRYLPLQLSVDVCGLPPKPPEDETDYSKPTDSQGSNFLKYPARKGAVRTVAKEGRLVAVDAGGAFTHNSQEFLWDMRKPCKEARLLDIVKFYVPKGVDLPERLKPGESLWALVTVPAEGPLRPLELAVSNATGFHPLEAKR